MIADVRTCLKQKSNCKLADVVRTIDRHIHNRNVFCAGIFIVYNIVARRKHGNRLEVRTLIHRRLADRRLVDNNDIRITDALRDQRRLLVRRAVIYRHRTQRLQRRPADVPRVLCISVQHYNLHRISSSSFNV